MLNVLVLLICMADSRKQKPTSYLVCAAPAVLVFVMPTPI